MKVGVLTFHKSINYGSVLQAWALQQTLLQNGIDTELIDYKPLVYDDLYSIMKKPVSISNLYFDFLRLPIWAVLAMQTKNFQNFVSQNLKVSREQYNFDSSISRIIENYDCVVCGSDQVWNVRAYDCDPIFFLPQSQYPGKKIAYAVSINNMDFTEKRYSEHLREWISDFDAISSREESGAAKIRAYLQNQQRVDTVLDPTLLLRKEDYDSILSENWIKGEYIFLYNVWSSHDAIDAAVALSKRLNIPVYTALMTRSHRVIRRIEKNGIIVEKKHTSPKDFLRMLRNARYVVTDSFHGTAFSIIFEKQFFSINAIEKDGMLKNDERLVGILEKLGLIHRYIARNQMAEINLEEKIDFANVTPERLKFAEISKGWLMDSIGCGER